MRDLPDSNRHALRLAKEKSVIKKRLRLLKSKDNRTPDITGKTHYDHVLEKKGRLAKQHPMDCGKAGCLLCHHDKFLKKQKARDKKLDDVMRSHLNPMEGYDDYSID